MKENRRSSGGRTAAHVLAFIGMAVLLIAIAAGAALYIATRGPSPSAREIVYDWASERGLGSVAGLFLSQEELAAMADVPGENAPEDDAQPGETQQPMISISEEAPETAEPEESAAPEESAEPEESAGPAEEEA